jgi:hypothetical protein
MIKSAPSKSVRPAARKRKKKLSGVTLAEAAYWAELIEAGAFVRVTLKTRDEVVGRVEHADSRYIRLAREGKPSLFLYKGDMLYVAEVERP